jgi:hypothetical protein
MAPTFILLAWRLGPSSLHGASLSGEKAPVSLSPRALGPATGCGARYSTSKEAVTRPAGMAHSGRDLRRHSQ